MTYKYRVNPAKALIHYYASDPLFPKPGRFDHSRALKGMSYLQQKPCRAKTAGCGA